jgi:hypothetical protein
MMIRDLKCTSNNGGNHMTRFAVTMFVLASLLILLTAPSSRAATLLFSEGYESGTHAPNWDGSDWSKSVFFPCQNRARSGNWSLCADYSQDGGNGNLLHSTSGYTNRDAYVSFWQWLPSGWTWPGGHWWHWAGQCWFFDTEWATDTQDLVSIQLRFYPKISDGSDGCPVVDADMWHQQYRAFDLPSKPMTDSNWHRIEWQWHQNSPGQSDGWMKWWYDGQPWLHLQDIAIVEGNLNFVDVSLIFPSNTQGVPSGRMANYDDFEAWDGCPTSNTFPYTPSCRSGGDSIPPAPPRSLHLGAQ